MDALRAAMLALGFEPGTLKQIVKSGLKISECTAYPVSLCASHSQC